MRAIASSLEATLAVEVRAYTLLRNVRFGRVRLINKDCIKCSLLKWKY